MTEFCFDVLGIAPTQDKNKIKKAYRALLHGVNPEDDTEGFQRLRRAYEEACQYASHLEKPVKKSTAEQFVEQCEQLYNDFFRRMEEEEWERLFSEPACVNLETGEEIRRAFLEFLMGHFNFPAAIWRKIDRAFEISGNRKELTEWFSEDFVDFLQQIVKDPGILNYALFEGDGDAAAFDEYIACYQNLRQHVDLAMLSQAQKDLERLEKMPVYHPYGDVEKGRLLVFQDKAKEAGKIFRSLGERYRDEERIQCCYGQFLQKEGCWEELDGLYDAVLSLHPDSASAKRGKAEELLHQGEFRKARRIILELLEENPQDEKLMQDLTDANVFLIEDLEKKQAEGSWNQDEMMELAWCYYQNMRLDDAIAFLDDIAPDNEHLLDYHNLKGRAYLTRDENEKALEHLFPWLEMLLDIRPDGTKKTERRLARLGYAYYTIGAAKAAILLQNGGTDFSEAMGYFNKAIEKEKEEGQIVSYYHTMADILRQNKEYGRVVDVCDKLLQINQGYYPAVLLRQEAYLHLGMYQAVADDYERAVHMYPFYGKPYATLIKMFFAIDDYEKAGRIFDLTAEQKVESDELEILKARYEAVISDSKAGFHKALRRLEKLKQRGWSYSSDLSLDEWSDIDYWRGILLVDLGQLTDAEEALEEALRGHENDVDRIFSYAMILMKCEKYERALEWLKKAEALRQEDENIWYRLGWCYKMTGDYPKALHYMKKVLEARRNHPAIRYVIADIYERMARRDDNNGYYEAALPYMIEQVEQHPEEYYFIELGLLYLDMDQYEKALEYFKKAREINPESVYADNNAGNCYLSMNMPEAAEPFFQRAIRFMKDNKTPLPYNNLAKCYRMLGDYEEARKCYEKNMALFPEHEDIYLLLGDFFRENRQFDKAIETYREGIGKARTCKSLELELFRTLGMKGAIEDARQMADMLRGKYPAKPLLHQLIGEVLLFGLEDAYRAEDYLKTALSLAEEAGEKEGILDSLYLLGRCCYHRGDMEEGRDFFRRFLKRCRGVDGDCRQYEEFYGEQGRRSFRIGSAYWFLGEINEAEQCFLSMNTDMYRCDGCARPFCYEKNIGEAMILWSQGERQKAIELYGKVADAVPDDMEHQFQYKQMKKMEEST